MKAMRILFGVIVASLLLTTAFAQVVSVTESLHNLSPQGPGPVKATTGYACLFCHAPHRAMGAPTPLWNHQLSTQTYDMYTSTTYHQNSLQPQLGSSSKLCLSCHDGTVAVGQTVSQGLIATSGTMVPKSNLGADMRTSHPFSFATPIVDNGELKLSLLGSPAQTADPAVKLVQGTVECTTCHDAHTPNIDLVVQEFLVRDSSSGQLCLACHDPTRIMGTTPNYLGGWAASAHATAANTTQNSPYVGGYGTVAQNACSSCHMPHNASSPARLLRGANEQDCITCHGGSNTLPALLNVAAEFAKSRVHPLPTALAQHDRAEAAVPNNNRHATCVDCHNPHAAQPVGVFGAPPAIRASQQSAMGVSATDGMTVINPAVNQFETCFRCHGTSAGKVADPIRFGYLPWRLVTGNDPLNIILQLSSTSTSSHPVTHDRSSAYSQPSLRTNMLQLNGATLGRTIGTRIFCTDCHNSDDNREFGGTGPNGPHGSNFPHLLERRYEISQAPSPGALISNVFLNPDLGPNGPYALCGKCHDLNNVLSDQTFTKHNKHVWEFGLSCSGCHTPHGMGGTNPSINGARLVDFDLNVVGPTGTTPITFNRANKTCTLTCHGYVHTDQNY